MRKKHSRACGRGAERAVVQHALIRLTVGKREEPGTNHANAIDHFPAHQMTKLGAIFRWNYSGGMIGRPVSTVTSCPSLAQWRESSAARAEGAPNSGGKYCEI